MVTTRRPRPHGALNRGAILAVARRIADAEGLGELTLRRVAAELDTGQASLYRHIADRAELLALLVDDLAAGYPLIEQGHSPTETVTAQWMAIYDYLAAHPWGAQVIAGGAHHTAAATPIRDRCLSQLRAAGMTAQTATRTYRALWPLVIGHLLNKHTFSPTHDPAGALTPAEFEWAVRNLLAGALKPAQTARESGLSAH
ncbi:TetR/AcrR family transcriptional regulator [Pseudonocardia acaciae]|uniref:TetR/AcrR family transcriptional regulator n=1 Tax=Pseudonocardia acaciae TaxID=551276 RepID=UPI0007E8DEAF|nr:TetR family transcriptional regulator [Pseudonocardia acaciae]